MLHLLKRDVDHGSSVFGIQKFKIIRYICTYLETSKFDKTNCAEEP